MKPHKMSSNWSTERSLQLIELFRQHRSLWDTKDPGYRNRNSKYDVWGEIALVMNDSRNEVERKMKNLLCHFHREYGKVNSSKVLIRSTKRYISRWFGYEPLLFLKERLLSRKMKTENTQPAEEEERSLDSNEETFNVNWEPETEIIEDDKETTTYANAHGENVESVDIVESGSSYKLEFLPPINYGTSTKRKASETTTELHQSINPSKIPKDEYDMFGERVAQKIRKLKTHYAKEKVEHMVNTILFEASIGTYDYPSNSFSTALTPVSVPTASSSTHFSNSPSFSATSNTRSPSPMAFLHENVNIKEETYDCDD